MAQFEPAIQNTEKWEGGWTNDPNDAGGETYIGISRNTFPNWTGWTQIDLAKNQEGFPKTLSANSTLQALVVQFYRQNFWRYDAINDQAVANKIFDCAVNVGLVHANKIAQKLAGCNPDGIVGPATIEAINHMDSNSFLNGFRAAAEEYHKEIVADHPEDAEFLSGWLRRDES